MHQRAADPSLARLPTDRSRTKRGHDAAGRAWRPLLAAFSRRAAAERAIPRAIPCRLQVRGDYSRYASFCIRDTMTARPIPSRR
jgi:hypothetical protein